MRHPCNLCSLQFTTEKILEQHVASFHIYPDASRVQPILTVVLEKIKIEPELIRLDEEDDDDHQTTSTVQKPPPKAIFEKTKIVKRLKLKDCYQCKVCLETFSLLRYFRKHLATAEEQGVFICQEYYKTNINNGYLPVCNNSYMESIANTENGQTTEEGHSRSRKSITPVNVQTFDNSRNGEHVMIKSKTGSKNNKQRSGVMDKQGLSNTIDNNINFQQRHKNHNKLIQAVKCAARAPTNENSEDNIAIALETQSESVTGNAEDGMPVLNTPETFPTPQVTSCKECHLTCASYEQLCIHYSKHHNLPMIVLKHMDKHELYRKYKRHVENVSKNKSFICDTCSGKFSSRYYFKKHTTCGPCAYSFSDYHLKTSKNDISSSEIDAPKSSIDLYMQNILKYPKKPYELRKNLLKSSMLRKHNFFANSQLCHKCNVCNQQLSSLTMLRKHKLAVHKNKNVSFNNVQQRQVELISTSKEFNKLSAHGRFRFKCDLCQKDFSTKKYLKLHKRGAHDGFRHKCELCPKDFPLMISLKLHKFSVHNGVRRKCESCPKTFTQLGQLNLHKRTAHDGVRYNCDLCQKKFTQLGRLNQHKRTVHNGVHHKCELCPANIFSIVKFKKT